MKTTIDASGCVRLPEDLQTAIGVKPGDEVVLEERAGECVIKAARADSGLVWEGNVLVHRGISTAGTSVEELIDFTRNDRLRDLADGLSQ